MADLYAWIDPTTPTVTVRARLGGKPPAAGACELAVSIKNAAGEVVASRMQPVGPLSAGEPIEVALAPFDVQLWSVDSPTLYTVEGELRSADGRPLDRLRFRTGFRRTTMDADHFHVNGKPVFWTSILHWGCYPQHLAPFLDENDFRQEIRRLKRCGFNGVNICLFMFPEQYYEVADEEGMMLWQEYPLWFYDTATPRPETAAEKDALIDELVEMFTRDRRHPSVVLRSMACEDPQADDYTMRRLYELCHEMIPGSLAQDNTSFLTQKYADFFDMHPYEEDEVFAERMRAWTKRSRELGQKPFLFGEGLDNDTFRDYDAIEQSDHKPWWTEQENCLALMGMANSKYWEELSKVNRLKEQWGSGVVRRLVKNSRAHSYASRKYQIEQSRLYKMFAGLSLTAISDVICTRPGVMDELGDLKWTPQELRVWNAPTMLIFDPQRKSRCYVSGERVTGQVHLSHYGAEPLEAAELKVTLLNPAGKACGSAMMTINATPGFVGELGKIDLLLPEATQPAQFTVEATQPAGPTREAPSEVSPLQNRWTLWVYPQPSEGAAAAWARGLPAADDAAGRKLVRMVEALTPAVETYLRQGGRVLLLQQPNQPGLPAHGTPFYRETALLAYDEQLFQGFPWQGYIDHQFFGLRGTYAFDVMAPTEATTDATTLLRTINCRHLAENDYVVARPYGQGVLIATTLNLLDSSNPSGRWLFDRLIDRLVTNQE